MKEGFEGLMDGAMPNGDDEPDKTAIASVNARILRWHDREEHEQIGKPVFSTMLEEESDDNRSEWARAEISVLGKTKILKGIMDSYKKLG